MSDAHETEHFFFYKIEGAVSPRELADSLLGLDGVAKQGGYILSQLLGGTFQTEIVITHVEIGSYKETFLYRLFLGKEKDGEKKIDELRRKLGLEKLSVNTLITLALVSAVGYGAYLFAVKKDSPPQTTVNVNVNINSFNGVAGELNMKPEEVLALIQEALKGKEEDLKKSVIKLAHPAGDTRSGDMVIDGKEELKIPRDVTAEIPSKYQKDDKVELTKNFNNVRLLLRAADLDQTDKGWFAVVDDVSQTRLPIEVSPSVKKDTLIPGKYIYGDVTVHYKLNKKGERKPTRIALHNARLNEDDASQVKDQVAP